MPATLSFEQALLVYRGDRRIRSAVRYWYPKRHLFIPHRMNAMERAFFRWYVYEAWVSLYNSYVEEYTLGGTGARKTSSSSLRSNRGHQHAGDRSEE